MRDPALGSPGTRVVIGVRGIRSAAPDHGIDHAEAHGMAQEQQTSMDYEAVTSLMQQIWSKGDFAYVAPVVQFVADQLVESVDVLPGDRVLDVACGSGNAAIACLCSGSSRRSTT
jgi:predicted nicotinamide N-methyase